MELCPICENELIYRTIKEIHTELEPDDPYRIEEIVYLYCEECGFDSSED